MAPRPDEDDPRSDVELVAAANRGEAAAFEAIYVRHRDWIVAVSARIGGDRELALDVLQEVTAYWLAKFPGFVLTGEFRAFLYPAVRNATLNALRRLRRGAPAAADDPGRAAEPLASLDSETSDALRAVLALLPETQREVLLLHFGDGLSLTETARALGIPIGTVKSRLAGALASLRSDRRLRQLFE